MQQGIVAKTFARDSIAECLQAVADHGFHSTQFNMKCVGLPTLPEQISPEVCAEIRFEHARRGLSMAAISATFNIIHPDEAERENGMRRFEVLAQAAPAMGTDCLTLCTGTGDAHDMWRRHPANQSAAAWRAMLHSMKRIVAIASQARVNVLVEPELSNVVDSAAKARKLLDELGSPQVKILLDGANLIDSVDPIRNRELLAEAMELLGADIVLAHAKDVTWLHGPVYCPAGRGLMDYDYYLRRLSQCGFAGPLILHELAEEDVLACRRFIRERLLEIGEPTSPAPNSPARAV